MDKKRFLPFFFLLVNGLFAQINLSGFYPDTTDPGLMFGNETALFNHTIVVSNRTSTLPLTAVGRVYVFSNEDNIITQENIFYPDDAASSDQFGKTIAVNENFIVVGSPMHDEGFTDAGAVYVYRKTNNTWNFFQKIMVEDASANKQFGSFVKIQENSMFIVAPNDVNNDGTGAVYVYSFNETEWVFSQKLTIPDNSIPIGKIEIIGSLLIVSNAMSKFHTFIYDTSWTYSDSTDNFNHLEQNVTDFSFDGQRLFISIYGLSPSGSDSVNHVYILNRVNNSWQSESILPMDFNDFVIGKIAVSGNNLLVGYDSYILNMSRKFPVFYYKRIENEWQMQTYFYGEGQDLMDDRLGNSISIQGSNVVMGAYTEGFLNHGKAYTFNLENLSTTLFEKNDITVFPNPTLSTVTVQNNSSNQLKSYELFSITGKLLQSALLSNNTISLENLQSGIYLLKISYANDLSETYKIIKK